MVLGIFTMVTNMGATWFSEGCGPQVPTWMEIIHPIGWKVWPLKDCKVKAGDLSANGETVTCQNGVMYWLDPNLEKGGVLTALNRSKCPPIGGKCCHGRVLDICSLSSRHHSESQARKLQNNPPLPRQNIWC
jgi:hypothetical protein